MNLFCSLPLVKIGSWYVKASSFDDQILIILRHPITMDLNVLMFYNEEEAHTYLERLDNDSNCETRNRGRACR